jgi:hypothetical protein
MTAAMQSQYQVYCKRGPDEADQSVGEAVAPIGSSNELRGAIDIAIFHAGFSLADILRMKGHTFAEISQNEEVQAARRQDKSFLEQEDGTWTATIGGFSYVIWQEAVASSTPGRAS